MTRAASRLALLTLLLQVACTPPGKGEKALAGFKASAVIIQGLGEFHAKHAAYPEKLDELAPSILTSAQLSPPSEIGRYDYERKATGFSLAFRYTGPGVNHCTFESSARTWSCGGHY